MKHLGVALAIASLLAAAGCKKKDDEASSGSGEASKGSTAEKTTAEKTSGGKSTSEPLLLSVEGVQLLPKTSLAVVVVEGLGPLGRRAGLAAIKEKYPKHWKRVVRGVGAGSGLNPLDVAAMAEVGLDTNTPMGAAMLSDDPPLGAVFVGMSDAAKAEAWLKITMEAMGEKDVKRSEAKGAVSLVTGNGEIGVVLRGKTMLTLFADDADGGVASAVEAAMKREPADSLASNPKLVDAVKTLSLGESLMAWVNLAPAVNRFLGVQVEKFTGPLGVIAIGGTDAGAAVEFECVWLPGGESRLLTPFRNLDGRPAIVRATTRVPRLLGSWAVDMNKLQGLATQLSKDLGADPMELAAMGLSELGIDLKEDVLGLLTGEVGGAMFTTAELDLASVTDDYRAKHVGGHFVLGVEDETKMKAVLEKLVKGGLPLKKEGERYTFEVPDWRTVTIAVVGGQLAVTTDVALFDRFAKSDSFVGTLENKPLKALFSGKTKAAVGVMDMRMVGWLFLIGRSRTSTRRGNPEVVALNKEIAERSRKLEIQTNQGILDVLKVMGTMAGTARITSGGLKARYGIYYGADSMAAVAMSIADMIVKRRTVWRDAGKAIDALREKRRTLLNQGSEAGVPIPSPGVLKAGPRWGFSSRAEGADVATVQLKAPAVEAPAADDKPDEAPAADKKAEEAPAADEKAEEAPAADEKAEEAPAADEKAEEAPAEDKKAEAPAREKKADDAPAADEKAP